jgi:hypothetical protein
VHQEAQLLRFHKKKPLTKTLLYFSKKTGICQQEQGEHTAQVFNIFAARLSLFIEVKSRKQKKNGGTTDTYI